jgi:hypothetical protein
MKPEDRQKRLMIIVIAGVALFAGDKLVFDPLKGAWDERQATIKKLKHDVDYDNSLIRKKDRILARWDKMQKSALPQDRAIAESKVFDALSRWEQRSGIKVERRQPQWKDGDDYTTLELFIDATGSVDQCERFLYELERDIAGLAVRVESLDLVAKDNYGSQLALGLQLTGLVMGAPKDSNK